MKNVILSLLVLTFFSFCNTNKEKKIPLNGRELEGKPRVVYKDLKYKMKLPDTVIMNKLYRATIEFESDFDGITPSVHVDPSDTTKVRIITFYRFKHIKSPLKRKSELSLIDSVFVPNKNFEVDDIVFKEKGEFVFCGLIKDVIMFNHYNKKGVRDSVHFEELNQQILKKVVVID